MSPCAPLSCNRTISDLRMSVRPVTLAALGGLLASSVLGSTAAVADGSNTPPIPPAQELASTSEEVPLDHSALDRAIQRAKKAGVPVNLVQEATESVGRDAVGAARERLAASIARQATDIDGATDRWVSQLSQWESLKRAAQEEYDSAMQTYRRDHETFQQQMGEFRRQQANYERLVEQQITHADPESALRPQQLIYEQPFTISADRNSLVGVTGIPHQPGQNNTFDGHNNYNSASVTHVHPVAGSSFTATYRNVAVDKATGRKLNATLQVSDVVVSTVNPGRPIIEVFSNFSDNIALYNVTAAKQTLTYTFADDGSPYNNRYYVSFGSLNGQNASGASRYEFAQGQYVDAHHGVVATFLNPDSEIAPQSQKVHGSAADGPAQAFMLPQGKGQSRSIRDTEPDIMRRLGVTFLAHNGSSFWVGTSGGSSDRDPQDVGPVTATYNHVMLSSDTVAPTAQAPVAPRPPQKPTVREVPRPEPSPVTARYHALHTDFRPTEKIAVDEGKFVLPGQSTRQTIHRNTGFHPLREFVLGDNILATDDGRIPVTVDPATVRVTAPSEDFTNRFRVHIAEAQVEGRKVLQIRAEAKEPASLPLDTDLTLHITQTALDDGKSDVEKDVGFAIINGKTEYTRTHSYPESVPSPHKYGVVGAKGSSVDGKTVTVGERLTYLLVLDASNLDRTVGPITQLGMFDDYDEVHGQVPADEVKVLAIPSTAQADSPERWAALTTQAEDVTGQFVVKDHGAEGLSIMARSQEGHLVPALGQRYLITVPYDVTKNSDGDIVNKAWQIVNHTHTPTESVVSKLRHISPNKHATSPSGNKERLDDGVIALHSPFVYDLESSTRPAHNARETTEWSIFDDYDQTHDSLDGRITVSTRYPLTLPDGSSLPVGADITRFFTIVTDEAEGTVSISARREFLDLLNAPEQREMEHGWTAHVPMRRIASGTVTNVFRESFNGHWLTSNTVTTRTPDEQNPTPPEPRPQEKPQEAPSPVPTPVSWAPPFPQQQPPGRTAHTGATGIDGQTPWAAGALGATAVIAGAGAYRGRHRRRDRS